MQVDERSTRAMVSLWKGFWKGGYYEGDPLDPFGRSSYAQMGFVSVLHAIYQVCIKPHATSGKRVLEIGCGQGAWTKTMLAAREIWCLDVNSAEHNRFWQHIGAQEQQRGKVRYFQVADFSCKELPDNYFDVLFSFGTCCHIPVEGQRAYFRTLLGKMRKGASAVVMIGDYDKYNAAVATHGNLALTLRRYPKVLRTGRRLVDIGRALADIATLVLGHRPADVLFDPMGIRDKRRIEMAQGSWFHAGVQETCEFVKSIGWEVVSPDLGLCVRDPLILLRRPA